MLIRPEQSTDIDAIRMVVRQAFAQDDEAALVDRLRDNGKAIISLVAVEDEKIVGHILFTDAVLGNVKIIGLAPLAVLPEWQKRGVGTKLTQAGIEACRQAGYEAMIVLGHPAYYPRFGFVPARKFGFHSEYDVRDEVFMALELTSGALANCAGAAKYQPEFNDL